MTSAFSIAKGLRDLLFMGERMSNSDLKRLIKQGGLYINKERVKTMDDEFAFPACVRFGHHGEYDIINLEWPLLYQHMYMKENGISPCQK